jgi:hypothetical protein
MMCISELLFSAAAKVHKRATRGLAGSCRSKLKRRALTPDAPIRHDQHLLLLHCRGRQVYGSKSAAGLAILAAALSSTPMAQVAATRFLVQQNDPLVVALLSYSIAFACLVPLLRDTSRR